jgi:hypothetical protein
VENDCSQSCRKLLDTRMAADGFFRWSYQTSVTTTTPNTSRYHRLFGTSVRLVRVTHCRVNMAHESGNGDRLQASVSGRDISAVRRNSLRLDKERSKFVSVCFSNGGTRYLGHGHDFASAAPEAPFPCKSGASTLTFLPHGSLLRLCGAERTAAPYAGRVLIPRSDEGRMEVRGEHRSQATIKDKPVLERLHTRLHLSHPPMAANRELHGWAPISQTGLSLKGG